jgi:hypothetical protein
MQRARDLGGAIPSVLIRVAEFHLDRREDEAALRAMSEVLQLVESYDNVVFGYYADINIPIAVILTSGLPADARPRQAFFEHALGWARPEDAGLIWESLAADSLTTDHLASAYIDYLIDDGRCDQAREIWAKHLGERRGPYLESNWLFNAGFEQTLTGAAFDWRVRNIGGVGAERIIDERDGNSMLQLTFAGTHNVAYSHRKPPVSRQANTGFVPGFRPPRSPPIRPRIFRFTTETPEGSSMSTHHNCEISGIGPP